MSQVFHPIEKKIILAVRTDPSLNNPGTLKFQTGLSDDQIRRGIEWLKLKNLLEVKESKQTVITLGENAIKARENGLPEKRLRKLVDEGPKSLDEIKKELQEDFSAAIAYAKKHDWVRIENGLIHPKAQLKPLAEEDFILHLGTGKKPVDQLSHYDKKSVEYLKRRPKFINEKILTSITFALTSLGKSIDIDAVASGAIDVEASVPHTVVSRIHPLKEVINETREIFVSLGFSEVLGNLIQPSFWNFDALFTPQDHPARDMQDTFYIKDKTTAKFATATQINQVSRSHKNGWGYDWDILEAKKMVLRTHTTCVTIKYLAENKPEDARIFSLGRVFRNEKVSYKHLFEFNQVEGVVVGKDVTLRDLMGIQREFYHRMGLTKIKFWPTFFPYTEPSLQSMVYNKELNKWVELFGMGIFRPEVTKPLGITRPVLAWGGGIERIAMLKYGLEDVREFYNNNLSWLRSATRCQ